MSSTIRTASQEDLEAVNAVIESAVMTWKLAERVKRLSLSSYRYTELDLKHLQMVVAEDGAQRIIAVAAWEPAASKDVPQGQNALLLHGIYVHPDHLRQGIGRHLFQAAEQAAKQQAYDGLLVKAQEDAVGFFVALGMVKLQASDPGRDYANRYWKGVST